MFKFLIMLFLGAFTFANAQAAGNFVRVKVQGLHDQAFIFKTAEEALAFEVKIKVLFEQFGCEQFFSLPAVVMVEDFIDLNGDSVIESKSGCSNCQYFFRRIEAYCPLNYTVNISPSVQLFFNGLKISGFEVSVNSEIFYYSESERLWKSNKLEGE